MGSAILWTIAVFALVIFEMFAMEFTCLSLAMGCIAGAVLAMLGLPYVAQVVAAGVVSAGSLFMMAPLLRNRLTPLDTPTAVDLIVGSEAEVIEAIAPGTPGKVKLNGVIWSAYAQRELAVGVRVLVTELAGTRLTVMSREELGPGGPSAAVLEELRRRQAQAQADPQQ